MKNRIEYAFIVLAFSLFVVLIFADVYIESISFKGKFVKTKYVEDNENGVVWIIDEYENKIDTCGTL